MVKPRAAFGRFVGTVQIELLRDDAGRHARLLSDFAFIDQRGDAWNVMKGATIDGASIPRFLWSVTGGPFEGLYREASVPHDWYCDVRIRPWRQVHRMFYEAMMASGTDRGLAKAMYYAVYLAGPRWDDQTRANVQLALSSPPDDVTATIARGLQDTVVQIDIGFGDGGAPAGSPDQLSYFVQPPGTYRVIKDEHYRQTLKTLGKMSLEELEVAADRVRPLD